MAFTYVLTTDVGKVRLKLGDTGGVAPGAVATSGYAFEDAELDEFISEGGSVNGATLLALRVLYIDAAKRAKAFSLPGMSMNDTAKLEHIFRAIKMYGGELPTISILYPSRLPMDDGYVEPPIVITTS